MTVIGTNEKKVSVMSAKPADIPYMPLPKPVNTTPQVNATKGPTFNDAFSQFLNKAQKVEKEPSRAGAPAASKIPAQFKPVDPVNSPVMMAAQVKMPVTPVQVKMPALPIQVKMPATPAQMKMAPSLPATIQLKMGPTAAPSMQLKVPTTVKVPAAQIKQQLLQNISRTPATGIQRQQEEWTNKMILEAQQKKQLPPSPGQKVKTEMIQPYVSNQNGGMAVQPNIQEGQQVFYTINGTYNGNSHYNTQQPHYNMNGNGYQQSY